MSQTIEAAMALIAGYGLQVIGAVLILVLGWVAPGWISNGILRAFRRSERGDQTLVTFTASSVKYFVLTFTVIVERRRPDGQLRRGAWRARPGHRFGTPGNTQPRGVGRAVDHV